MRVEKIYCDRCDTEIDDTDEPPRAVIQTPGSRNGFDFCWSCLDDFEEWLSGEGDEQEP